CHAGTSAFPRALVQHVSSQRWLTDQTMSCRAARNCMAAALVRFGLSVSRTLASKSTANCTVLRGCRLRRQSYPRFGSGRPVLLTWNWIGHGRPQYPRLAWMTEDLVLLEKQARRFIAA